MTIDWTNFTPWTSLTGGVLLGIASSLFILVNGRILGISGILGGLFRPAKGMPDGDFRFSQACWWPQRCMRCLPHPSWHESMQAGLRL